MGRGFSGLDQDLVRGQAACQERQQYAGTDQEPLDTDPVGQRTENEHGGRHDAAGDHAHHAEYPAEIIGFDFFLQQDGRRRIIERQSQPGNGHDAQVDPEIRDDTQQKGRDTNHQGRKCHGFDAVSKTTPGGNQQTAHKHPAGKDDFDGGQTPDIVAETACDLQRRQHGDRGDHEKQDRDVDEKPSDVFMSADILDPRNQILPIPLFLVGLRPDMRGDVEGDHHQDSGDRRHDIDHQDQLERG